MRRSRRGRSGMEFGGSGEDSFVAVVVTKLTGALLFILLLTMVIMALLPKAIDLPSSPARPGQGEDAAEPTKLAVTTPESLPEAIAGRPYRLALAADGGTGHLRWSLSGPMPDGLAFDPEAGLISGTPTKGTPEPAALSASVTDGPGHAGRALRLVVYQPDVPLATPSRWKPALPPIPWREWLNQGFGFLVVWLVFLVGLGTLDALRRRAEAESPGEDDAVARRHLAYKVLLSLATLGATAGLAAYLWWPRG